MAKLLLLECRGGGAPARQHSTVHRDGAGRDLRAVSQYLRSKRNRSFLFVSSIFRKPTSGALLCLEARRGSRSVSHGNARNGHGARCRVTDSSTPCLVTWNGMEGSMRSCRAALRAVAPDPRALLKYFAKFFTFSITSSLVTHAWSTKYR